MGLVEALGEGADCQILLLVGAEGGLSPREEEVTGAAGLIGAHLVPRRLRVETAAIAALAGLRIVLNRW